MKGSRISSVRSCYTSRSPTHKSHPDAGRGKLDEREIVGVVLFEARGDSSEVLELVEEALHEIAEAVEKGAESWPVHAPGHGLDVGPGATLGHARAQRVAVIGAVGEQDLARTEGAEHVGGTLAVVGLAGAELQGNRIAVGIDEGVDLGRQSAPRAPMHLAPGLSPEAAWVSSSRPPF